MIVFGSDNRMILYGSIFILHTFFSVRKIVTEAKFIRGDLKASNVETLIVPADNEDEACQIDKGEGILIDRIIYGNKLGLDCITEINTTSSRDVLLRQALQRECNGKNRCYLCDSKTAVSVMCGDHLIQADQIDIHVECIPVKPENKQVISLMSQLSTNISYHHYNKSNLVLELPQARLTEIHCDINGNNQEFKFTLLHVDFGCKGSDRCHGYINITNDKMEKINYTYNSLPRETYNQHMRFVSFDVSMDTGLIWILLEAYKTIQVQCKETKEISLETDNTAGFTTFPTSEAITTTAGYEPSGNTTFKVDMTTKQMDDTTKQSDDKEVSAQEIPLEINLPVSVAGLITLLAIALCVACVCSRRRNAPKIGELKIPSSAEEEAEYTHLNHCTNIRKFENVYDG